MAVGNIRTSESTRRDQGGTGGAANAGPPVPAGGVAGRRDARRRRRCTAHRGPGRGRGDVIGHLHAGPGADAGPAGLDDGRDVEVGHRGQRLHHLGAGAGPVPGCAHRGEGVLRHDQRPGRCPRPQADRRLQGRRVQRPAEPDRHPGGDQQRLRPGGQLLALRWLRVRRLGQQHRGARRLGHARRRHRRAAQRLQRPAPVAGDPRAGRVLQEALPQGHDGRGHRLRRGVGRSRLPGSWPP